MLRAGYLLLLCLSAAGQNVSEAQAYRFLAHSTFGPTPAEIRHLQQIGYTAWIEEQFATPVSGYPAYLDLKPLEWSQDYFFENAISHPDQLRQRVAFALHKIFVVSGNEVTPSEAYVPYLRLLHQDAFGNHLDLLRDITLNPAMGEYLDMVDNDKTDPESADSPNENYARELLQLFTIGLVELAPDGTQRLDANANPVPAYSQRNVLEFARAFTGWTYAPEPGRVTDGHNPWNYSGPMVAYDPLHDTGSKILLRGASLPAGQSARDDLEAALRNIFEHPNAGPFLARGLIQQLVTSNPSPAYIARVAAAFDGGGARQRGDLKAVIAAVLLDEEALTPSAKTGHLREPALYVSALMRALGGKIAEHPFLSDSSDELGQKIFYPPSVFSYYSPFYRLPRGGAAAPEFQIVTSQSALSRINFAGRLIYGGFGSEVEIDLTRFVNAAADPDALLDLVNHELAGGRLPARMRGPIREAVVAQTDPLSKAQAALYLVASSPFYQVID